MKHIARIAFLLFIGFPFSSFGTIFYIDPINGSMDNDGSYNAPWLTLQEVIENNLIETRSYLPLPYDPQLSILMPKNVDAPVAAGDTLMLRNGLHGELFLRGGYNIDYITIMAENGHEPLISFIKLSACSKWRLVDLTISPEPFGGYNTGHLIFLESHGFHGPASQIEIKGCNLFGAQSTKLWTADDWVNNVGSGIYILGDHSLIRNNTLTNIDHGITIVGDSAQVINNQITNFRGDGIRPLGSDLLISQNVIKNCYDVDDNHDDGIQSFTSFDNPFERVHIIGNTIINYEDSNQPFKGSLQGIGCFDGPYVDWVIENNLISVDHWHGISLYGAFNCQIINNTVIDPTPDVTPGPVWIRVDDHKNGTPSEGCIVKNNLTNRVIADAILGSNTEIASYEEYEDHFKDYLNNDFHLKEGCISIDIAEDAVAPSEDIEGTIRPQGIQSDIGAYEFVSMLSPVDPELELENTTFFPNPVMNVLSIQRQGLRNIGQIKVVDGMGKSVLYIYPALESDGFSYDVSSLPSGLYYVQSDIGYLGIFIKL